jgi:hypothetical protein
MAEHLKPNRLKLADETCQSEAGGRDLKLFSVLLCFSFKTRRLVCWFRFLCTVTAFRGIKRGAAVGFFPARILSVMGYTVLKRSCLVNAMAREGGTSFAYLF